MYIVSGVGVYLDGKTEAATYLYQLEDTTTVLGRVVTTVALSRHLPELKTRHSGMVMIRIIVQPIQWQQLFLPTLELIMVSLT